MIPRGQPIGALRTKAAPAPKPTHKSRLSAQHRSLALSADQPPPARNWLTLTDPPKV